MRDEGKEVKEFWQIYKDTVLKTGVPIEKVEWYVQRGGQSKNRGQSY